MTNGTNGSNASGRVVDLLTYKREQHQRRLNFESTPPPSTPSLAPVTPFRPLTAKAVTHRERMIRHLSRRP
jgi:hypothetical protein